MVKVCWLYAGPAENSASSTSMTVPAARDAALITRQHGRKSFSGEAALLVINEEPIGDLPDRYGGHHFEVFGIDDRDIVRQPVGDVEHFLVGTQRQPPRAMAYQNIVQDLAAWHVDHGNVIGAAKCDIGSLSITRDA